MGKVLSGKDGARLCSNHQGMHYSENIRDLGKDGTTLSCCAGVIRACAWTRRAFGCLFVG